jgi:hypothetical protein
VGHGAHVSAGGDAGAEAGSVAFHGEDFEFLDFHLYRLQDDFLFLSRQLVGGDTVDFLGGEGRRHLVDHAAEGGREGHDLV